MQAYTSSWNSLCSHPVPEWFRDAKLGIYTHWGPYSVPAYGGSLNTAGDAGIDYSNTWYPRYLYDPKSRHGKYHEKTYGGARACGYKDLIPRFTGEKFDPDQWVEVFGDAGARFVGPTAQLHDGFAMWKSDVNRWNCAAMGPKRDVAGEFSKAARRADLKFVTTFHHSFNWFFYQVGRGEGYDLDDPQYEDLYGRRHDPEEMPDGPYHDRWLRQLVEVVDQYAPDLVWFDFGLGFIRDDYKQRFLEHYYNAALRSGQDVAVAFKRNHLPPGSGVQDLEVGKLATMGQAPWLTDTSIDCVPKGCWAHSRSAGFKSPERLVHTLVDIVSKNGQLLLNVGPRADGSIPEGARASLRSLGAWLRVNGEAIYNTRPWSVFGEGPAGKAAQATQAEFNETGEPRLCAHDIRYTAGNGAVYAICLGVPGDEVFLESFRRIDPAEIGGVTMLGAPGPLRWRHDRTDGLIVETPERVPSEYANCLRIEMKQG